MAAGTFMKGARPWSIGALCLLAPSFALADAPAACDPRIVDKAEPG